MGACLDPALILWVLAGRRGAATRQEPACAYYALPKRCQNVAKIWVALVHNGPLWGAPYPARTPVYLG